MVESSDRMALVVKAAHQKTRGTYGVERLHKELIAEGHKVSLWKGKDIRRKYGLAFRRKRTMSNHEKVLFAAKFMPNAVFRRYECGETSVGLIRAQTRPGLPDLQISGIMVAYAARRGPGRIGMH